MPSKLNSLAPTATVSKTAGMSHTDYQKYLVQAFGVPPHTAAQMAASPESRAATDASIASTGSPYSLQTPQGGAGSSGVGAAARPAQPQGGGGGYGGGHRGDDGDGYIRANRAFNVHTGLIKEKGALRDDSATARLMAGKQPYDDPKSPQPSRAKDGRAALADQTTSAAEKEETVKSFNVHGGKNAGGAMRASDIPAAKPATTTDKPTNLNLLDDPAEKNFLGTESPSSIAAQRTGEQPAPAQQQTNISKLAHDDPSNPANNLSEAQRTIAAARSGRDTEHERDTSYMSASGTKRSIHGMEYDPKEISHSRIAPKFASNEEHRADQRQRHDDRMKSTATSAYAQQDAEKQKRQTALDSLKADPRNSISITNPEKEKRERQAAENKAREARVMGSLADAGRPPTLGSLADHGKPTLSLNKEEAPKIKGAADYDEEEKKRRRNNQDWS